MAQQITKVLVIIDMQPEFCYAAKSIIPQVVKAIEKAKKEQKEILLIEYAYKDSSHTRTYREILQTVSTYKNKKVVYKYSDDGSKEIMQILEKRKVIIDVCGVNLGACVRSTVKGLLRNTNIQRINILKKAVNDEWGVTSELRWFKYPKRKNLKIVE
jgi:nicotinamidase-related amidase